MKSSMDRRWRTWGWILSRNLSYFRPWAALSPAGQGCKARTLIRTLLALGCGAWAALGADTGPVTQAEIRTPPTEKPAAARPEVSRSTAAERGEIAGRRAIYSGILIQASVVPQPWILLSPAAPAALGRGEQNLVRDEITGRTIGLSFFTIRW